MRRRRLDSFGRFARSRQWLHAPTAEPPFRRAYRGCQAVFRRGALHASPCRLGIARSPRMVSCQIDVGEEPSRTQWSDRTAGKAFELELPGSWSNLYVLCGFGRFRRSCTANSTMHTAFRTLRFVARIFSIAQFRRPERGPATRAYPKNTRRRTTFWAKQRVFDFKVHRATTSFSPTACISASISAFALLTRNV